MEDEYTQEEIVENGNMMYGGKRHDAICDEMEKSGYKDEEINLISIGIWKGIESEREVKQKEIERLQEENNKLRTGYENAFEFFLKLNGESESKSYIESPDYWHDIGWEKDLDCSIKLARRTLQEIREGKVE